MVVEFVEGEMELRFGLESVELKYWGERCEKGLVEMKEVEDDENIWCVFRSLELNLREIMAAICVSQREGETETKVFVRSAREYLL